MNVDLIGNMDRKAAERQNRLEVIQKEIQNGTYKNGNIKAEYIVHHGTQTYSGLKIENDIFFNSEIFHDFMDLEKAAELVYFLEHVLKHQK